MIESNLMIVPLSHYRKWLIPFQDEKTREFIRKAQLVHGDKYNYKFVKYIGSKNKVCIYCSKHKVLFWQTPNNHLSGQTCFICGKEIQTEKKQKTTKSFVQEAILIHGDKYDYSKVHYEMSNKEVCISCHKHGDFWQKPEVHLAGHGCPKCGFDTIKEKISDNTSTFIEKARKIHGDQYDYSKTKYVNATTKVIITCKTHGDFTQLPYNHLQGHGCVKCNRPEIHNTEDFIIASKRAHGDKYDYSKTKYINCKTKVTITCRIHGDFTQSVEDHVDGHGCPLCGFSNICESYVGEWLDDHGIENIRYYTTNLIKISGHIIIDYKIVLNGKEVWLEYNGPTHYMLVNFFHNGNIENFKNQLRRDEKVRNYCNKNNIRLIEIPYTYNTRESIFEFLDKVITKGIDPYTFIDYESLFKRPLDYESIIKD